MQVAKKSLVAVPDYTGNKPIGVGVNSHRLDDFFTGSLDELRIFKRGLTSKEIEQQYITGLSSADGQVSYLPFN